MGLISDSLRTDGRNLVITMWLVAGLAAAFVMVLIVAGPIAQPEAYHEFADQRTLLGIPHCLNVVSSLLYLVAGCAGLWFVCLRGQAGAFLDPRERWVFGVLFLGVLLTAFGSIYYHLEPADARLLWDRLPMAVVFMASLAAVIAERSKLSWGLVSLVPLVAAGIGSLVYWRATGDLRLYIFTQFFPLAAVPIMMLLLPARHSGNRDLLAALGWYLLAKVAEAADLRIYIALGRTISGHTLKHVLSAVAALWLVHWLWQRRPARTI